MTVIASEAKQSPEIKRLIPGDCPARRKIAALLAMISVKFVPEWWIPMLLVQVLHPHTDREQLGHPYFNAYGPG
jgi:hypothetical protein